MIDKEALKTVILEIKTEQDSFNKTVKVSLKLFQLAGYFTLPYLFVFFANNFVNQSFNYQSVWVAVPTVIAEIFATAFVFSCILFQVKKVKLSKSHKRVENIFKSSLN